MADREEILAKLDTARMCDQIGYAAYSRLHDLISEITEQKHGHWKLVQDYYDDEHWQCSACGCEWYLEAGTPEENNMHYCPECGAKMDEEVEQNETD